MRKRPNKLLKTAEYIRQCRVTAAGIDAGEHMDTIAARLGVTPRHVYRIRDDMRDLGWPSMSAEHLVMHHLLEVFVPYDDDSDD